MQLFWAHGIQPFFVLRQYVVFVYLVRTWMSINEHQIIMSLLQVWITYKTKQQKTIGSTSIIQDNHVNFES